MVATQGLYRQALLAEIAAIQNELLKSGVYLRMGRDFDAFAATIDAQSERAELHSQFDPNGDMDGAVDAFWICGFDANGELIHTQAVQLLNLGARTISDHIACTLRKYHPKSPPVIRSSIRTIPGPKISKISGRVVYHGEMWLRNDLRDKATASMLIRAGMYMTTQEWDPDAIFGLMSWILAIDGFNMRIGYTHSEQMTLVWDKATDLTRHEVWAVFMEREDIRHLLQLSAIDFASFLRRQFNENLGK